MTTRLVRRCAAEDGVSIVEVVVAGLILVIGALAVLGLADAANRTTYRAEQGQVVVDRLQAEMEKLRQLPFDEMALTSAPATSSDPNSPAHRVSGTTFALGQNGTDARPLAIQGGSTPTGDPLGCGAAGESACGVDPGPVSFQSGDVRGRIYRYVVYPGVPSNCTGCTADDLKRIIVAIRLDATSPGGTRAYQELQSDIVTDRDREGSVSPPTGGSEGDEIATFWLTDTPCSSTARQDVSTTDHNTHNTRGECSLGGQTGSTKGAPDLMFDEQPAESSTGTNPYIDYAADVEPTSGADQDKGLQLLKPTLSGSTGCLLQAPTLSQLDFPTLNLESNKHQKMHTWLTNELDPNFSPLTTSSATLELYTRTVSGAGSVSGKICYWVFKRVKLIGTRLIGGSTTYHVDLPAVVTNNSSLLYGQFQRAFWPSDWTEVSIPMNLTFVNVTDYLNSLNLGSLGLTSLTVSGEPRLGLSIQVEKTNTTGDGLEFMYDHPNFASRLEVQSSTCILLCS
jgi:hypothetical protein